MRKSNIRELENLQNAFAMATFPMIEINGTITIPESKFLQISTKVSVRFSTLIEKDGGAIVGRPASIWPVRAKGTSPWFSNMYDATAHKITTRAFLPVPTNQINFLKIPFETLMSLSFWNKRKIQKKKKKITYVRLFSRSVFYPFFPFLRIHGA